MGGQDAGLGGSFAEAVMLAYPWFVATGLGMARPFGLFLVLPVIARASPGAVVRGGISFALALPAAAPVRNLLLRAHMTDMLPLVGYGAKEVLAGVFLGVMLGLPIWAVQAVGELVDVQRGQTAGHQSDPGGGQMSTLAALLSHGAIGLFVIGNGLAATCAALYGSYRAWPVLEVFPAPNPAWVPFFLGLLDHIMHFALVTGGPIVLMLLAVDVTCILVARSVPKLGIADLIPTLKNLVFVGMMVLYIAFLQDYSAQEVEQVHAVADQFNLLFGPPSGNAP